MSGDSSALFRQPNQQPAELVSIMVKARDAGIFSSGSPGPKATMPQQPMYFPQMQLPGTPS